MNNLQGLAGDERVSGHPQPHRGNRSLASVLRRFVYHHPIYSTSAVRAQARHGEIDGAQGVHFCGAYWGYGFHEDGVKSGLAVAHRVRSEVHA